MKSRLTTTVFVAIFCMWIGSVVADSPPQWDRQQAKEHGWIYDDFDAGVAEAKASGKPMLVVLRCPP